ncbi:hypothetical protein NKJ26_03245 [Mesorhizobium sp. M0152]|uniref:hypothetical protein n=1 Tax=Mesorhizobium sp. M0152 TaxID=2956898 RepID=UPI00333890EA
MNHFKSKADVIGKLVAAFSESAGVDPVERAKAFMIAVEPLAPQFLIEAVLRFIRGEVEGHNPRFCPSTAELCAEARRLEAFAKYQERKREADKLPKPKAEQPLAITDAERAATIARLRAKFPTMFPQIEG